MLKILIRIGLSFMALMLYAWINALLYPVGMVAGAAMAGKQFLPDDTAYFEAMYSMRFFSNFGPPILVLIVALVAIWWPWSWTKGLTSVIVGTLLLGAQPARAYYDKTDYAEPYTILPNESAFWIPNVGDNISGQAKFDSADYLRTNKIPMKLFMVPHAKLENSGLWSNFYVPKGRLIIVDRTPYSREWVKDAHRGTSTSDDSFKCQSSEGLTLTVGVSIGTSVSEDNAPVYLSRFGVTPPAGSRTDPNIIFTSVYYGRSLTETMDQVEKRKIQTLICRQLMQRPLDRDNTEAIQMMDAIQKDVTAHLAAVGITLDFIGWADTFEFDKVVQDAINDRYAANEVGPVLDILKQKALLDSMTKNGWDGKLPASISLSWWPDRLSDWFTSFFHTPAQK